MPFLHWLTKQTAYWYVSSQITFYFSLITSLLMSFVHLHVPGDDFQDA